MNNDLGNIILKLAGFSIVLFGIHHYILSQFFEGNLTIPLWLIYTFNAVLVFIVISIIKNKAKKKSNNVLNIFLILTVVKMVLILVLLLPVFLKKSDHAQLEILNFFLPYFLFLGFEIYSLNKFLQKS